MSYTAFRRSPALPFVTAILQGKFCTPFDSLPPSGSYSGPWAYLCLNQNKSTLAVSAPSLLIPNYPLSPPEFQCGCTVRQVDAAKNEPFPFTTRQSMNIGVRNEQEKDHAFSRAASFARWKQLQNHIMNWTQFVTDLQYTHRSKMAAVC